MSEVLKKCLLLAREGNFVWIFTTFQTPDRKELFKFNGMTEHVGINIVNNDSLVSVISKILIKKKRFHIVINNNYFGNLTMQILNIKTTPVWDQVLYNKTKFL